MLLRRVATNARSRRYDEILSRFYERRIIPAVTVSSAIKTLQNIVFPQRGLAGNYNGLRQPRSRLCHNAHAYVCTRARARWCALKVAFAQPWAARIVGERVSKGRRASLSARVREQTRNEHVRCTSFREIETEREMS